MHDNSKEVGSGGSGNKETEDRKPLNILLVEDDKEIVPLIERVLEGHKVTVFDNAEQAFEKLRESQKLGMPFDWIITDRGLAGQMDGFGLADLIKRERLGDPFVTMLTASAPKIRAENSADELREKGIHQLMGKPFDTKVLKDSVTTVRDFMKQIITIRAENSAASQSQTS